MAAIWSRRCPLCAKSRHSQDAHRCPLYPQKRTLGLSRAMSAMCQKLTHAVQQLVSLLDNVVRAAEQRRRKNDFGIADIDLSQTIKVGTPNKIGGSPHREHGPDLVPHPPDTPTKLGPTLSKMNCCHQFRGRHSRSQIVPLWLWGAPDYLRGSTAVSTPAIIVKIRTTAPTSTIHCAVILASY
jgi:hypothetical protein